MKISLPKNIWKRAKKLTLFASLAISVAGCGGSLQVTKVNSAEEKPNNVWVFFTVMEGEEPVAGLQAANFEIYEDDKLVSVFESQQKILNPEVAAVSYTLLLLDMSGSVTEAEGGADELVNAALQFSERVGKSQKVAVYAFDGAEKIHSVVRFTEAKGSLKGGLEGLRSYKAVDPSTNLHGAVVRGLAVLKTELDRDKKPLKFGTLVVFSDGTDRASRVSSDEMSEALQHEDYEHYEMYAVGVGSEIDDQTLDLIGQDGSERVTDEAKLGEAFDRVAARIEAHMKRFYLLSYCTPSRAGEHQVRIVATTGGAQDPSLEWGTGDNVIREDTDSPEEIAEKEEAAEKKKGEKTSTGDVEYTFSADGFGPPPRCDPNRKPKFKLEASAHQKPEEDESSVDAEGKASVSKN